MKRSNAEKFLGVALLASLALVALGPWLLRTLAPQEAVNAAWARDEVAIVENMCHLEKAPLDPWGHVWCARACARNEFVGRDPFERVVLHTTLPNEGTYVEVLYSAGPNGTDELGAGDDVYPVNRVPWLDAYPRETGAFFASVVLWWLFWTRRRPSRFGRVGEACRVGLMSAPVIWLAWVVVERYPDSVAGEFAKSLHAVLPAKVVVLGSVTALTLALCAALRWSGGASASPDDATEDSPSPSP